MAVPSGAAYEVQFEHSGYTTWTHTTPVLQVEDDFIFEGANSALLQTKTIILVHGLFKGAAFWEEGGFDFPMKLREAPEGRYNVLEPVSLVPNFLDWLGPAARVTSQSERLAEHIDALREGGIQSVNIVAHSMGGLVSREYIRRHPGKVKTLVMLGTPNHGSEMATEVKWLLLWAERRFGLGLLTDIPPAGQDLIPDSELLRDLNYGGSEGESNWGCPDHPDETTLDAKTRYYTYRGTAFEPNPFQVCNLLGWVSGKILWNSTDGCDNDFWVPKSSVPLRAQTPLDNVHNWTDTDCDILSGHFRQDCPPMTRDDRVVDLVVRALDGQTACTGGAAPSPGQPEEGPAPQNVAHDYVLLPPGGSTDLLAACGTADSLVFRSYHLRGMTDLRLLDPSGRIITPDTAAMDPNIDYTELGGLNWFTVRAGTPGEWRMLVDAMSSDSAEVVLMAVEYGDVTLLIDVEDPELLPGASQRIEVTLFHGEAQLSGATVQGTVMGPDSVAVPIVLVDDGTNGDEARDDGVYTAIVGGHAQAGQYDLNVEATGLYVDGTVLNRRARHSYFAATRPDLELLADDVYLTFDVADSQTVVTVSLTFRNIGQARADSIGVRFLEQETGLVFAETYVSTLDAGQEAEIAADWVMRHGAPEYHLGARLSVLGSGGEGNILNNEAYGGLVVAGIDESDAPGNEPDDGLHADLGLQVFPNPFSSETTLRYVLHDAQRVELTIYDVSGRQVRRLVAGQKGPGTHTAVWDGRDVAGRSVSGGTYYARLRAGSRFQTRHTLLIR